MYSTCTLCKLVTKQNHHIQYKDKNIHVFFSCIIINSLFLSALNTQAIILQYIHAACLLTSSDSSICIIT